MTEWRQILHQGNLWSAVARKKSFVRLDLGALISSWLSLTGDEVLYTLASRLFLALSDNAL